MTTTRTVAVPSLPSLADAGPGTGGIASGPALTLTWAELHQEISQAEHTGLCRHPVRLKGRIDAIDLATGELRPVYDTATEPGGALLTACGNRRETICPPCSGVYKRDARQLVRAGLTGGKGIPETVAAHPCVFATFTAPSFGPVHARRMRGHAVLPCRPRRNAAKRVCPHGRDISCPVRHHPGDRRLGWPLCRDCYDYTAAVLFNACAADLWRRFTTYLPRRLAALAGMSQRRLRALVRVRYVKVAEYQARGVVHFHAIIRLDRTPVPGHDDAYSPPPPAFTADLLCDAIRQAAAAVAITADPGAGQLPVRLGFGTQTDARPIRHDPVLPSTGNKLSVQAVANYIAKYATKALDAPGIPARPLRTLADLQGVRCSRHYQRMITCAWQLGSGRSPATTRFRQWAHMLGYGGHFLTKSRRYSVTFGQLRTERTEHRRATRHPDGERDPWNRPLDETTVLILRTWTYDGPGDTLATGTQLALGSAARAREHRRIARKETAMAI